MAQEQPANVQPPENLWIHGNVIVVDKNKNFGFIRPTTALPPPFVSRNVHFMLQKASWSVQVNDCVEFQLNKNQYAKPAAFILRRVPSNPDRGLIEGMPPDVSTNSYNAAGLNSSANSAPDNAQFDYNSLPVAFKAKRPAIHEARRQGNVEAMKECYGFIRYSTITPPLEMQESDLYFSLQYSYAGHFNMCSGDLVSFYVRLRGSARMQAFDVRLVKCTKRPVEVIENYIRSVMDKVADIDKVESRKHVIVAVGCVPVWQCIGHLDSITDNGLKMLVELLIQMHKKEFLKEKAVVVYQTLHGTPLFAQSSGRFSCYINSLVSNGMTTELSKVHRLVLHMAQSVPKCGWQITGLVKPMVSSENDCCENFLYQLLRQFTRGSAAAIENMQWNELPLVPSVDEMVSGKLETYTSLQRVIEKGAYPSAESYLDTYFRLLRVDCFSALAKGVTDLLNGKLDSRDMNVYRGIQLVGVQLMHGGSSKSGLSIGLTIAQDKRVNWDQSSRLMFGNLLCISVSGTFQDPIWATVVSRDLLKKYQIIVIELCSDSNNDLDSQAVMALYRAGICSVMVESPTYYRAYQPVLKALQSIDPKNIAFSDELINCQHTTTPAYVMPSTEFDKSIVYAGAVAERLNVVCYCADEQSLGQTSLDASQEATLKQSLQNRIAIIQGPPGTGKTFVGAKIVQVLLSFSLPPRLPILILTYKNHSLDEFLKEMLKVLPSADIARVGGRSQEKDLSSCNLNELRRSKEYRPSDTVYKEIKFHVAEMERIKEEINDAFDDADKQQYFTTDSLLQAFDHEQLAVFLLQCEWQKTKQKPLRTGGGKNDWQTVSKTIRYTEVATLVDSCGRSTIQKVVEEESKLGKNLHKLLTSALSLWLPKEDDFNKFEQNFITSQGSVIARYEQLQKTDTSGANEWTAFERDVDETMQERLAASLEKQTTADELLKHFKRLDKSQNRHQHLLKTTQLVDDKFASSLTRVRNLWDLSTHDRIRLIQYVQQQRLAKVGKYLESLFQEYENMHRAKEELEDQQKANILQQMKIIGMTITGASINRKLIAQIKPEVILVEEAAEVLEPPVVAIMGDWVKHLILIGDHKQLRPAVENYMLAREYHLDLSLMERLINNGLPYATLTMQNRMRPEFAELLQDIYPHLQSNLARVESNKPANCIGKSMYLWDHNEPELSERSFTNQAEAKRAVHLALFLVEQGYQPCQITILSPYLRQVRLIRQMVREAEKQYTDLIALPESQTNRASDEPQTSAIDRSFRVHTVDLYQGDENDFVIVSLVRSNDRGNLGFLNVLNRRCVAQSRARCGLYFIGNKKTLLFNKNWMTLIEGLSKLQCVDTCIPLHCPSHPSASHLLVSSHEEIPLKQTFCSVVCGSYMSCNQHLCEKTCQPRHSHDACKELVQFTFLECGHSGERQCYEREEDMFCKTKIPHCFRQCNHLGYRKCFEKNEDLIICQEKCTKVLKCEHPCEQKCGEPCNNDRCSVCRKIQEAMLEKQREAEEKLRDAIRQEAKQKIAEIKEQNPEDCVLREDLQRDGDNAEEYYSIEDKVKKYVQPGHNWFPHVTRIEKVKNFKLEIQWLEAKATVIDPTRCDQKFHGTTEAAVNSIIKDGFILPKSKRNMFGPGIYFASDSSKSAQKVYTKGSKMLLVCDVLLGKAKTVYKAMKDMRHAKLKSEGYDSLFAKRGTKETGGVLYDEFVVYDPKQAIPRYVIHYEETDLTQLDGADMMLTDGSANLTQQHILPPKRARSLDILEMHFCIAESQFLRLMNKRNMQHEVQSVDLYINAVLMKRFQHKQAEMESKYPGQDYSKCILAFHGTKSENICSIVEKNFDLARLSSSSGDSGFYGAGIYFSEFPEVGIGYAQAGQLLLCKVLPGKSFICQTTMTGQGLQAGYDSHVFQPDVEGRGQELVIFDPDQILPCYVINFT